MRTVPAFALTLLMTACGGGGGGGGGNGGESAGLTDAQRVWCSDHDLERQEGGNYGDGAVVEAAVTLGLAVPDSISEGLELLKAFSRGESVDGPDDTAMAADLQEWRATADYARACVAAYDGR